MATMREIRNAIADDMSANGTELTDVLSFEDRFDYEMRSVQLDAWVDELPDGSWSTTYMYGRSERVRCYA